MDNATTGQYTVSKTFWALGNFSKFIRPGYIRIGTSSSDPAVLASAYRDPVTLRLVIVVINTSSQGRNVNFSFSGYDVRGPVTPYVTSGASSDNLTQYPAFSYDSTVGVSGYSVTTYVLDTAGHFNTLANTSGARAISGDFNHDGKTDIALVGVNGWTTIPIAFSNGDGTFHETNATCADCATFAAWASTTGAQVVVGDVDGDGLDDLIAIGAASWNSIKVAHSNGDGTFHVTDIYNASIPAWISGYQGVKVLMGDVNGDRLDDIILTRGAGWTTIPVGFSNGDGSFNVTNYSVANFPTWSQDPNAQVVETDVNGDGYADLVLTSGHSWSTVPVALSTGNGNWTVYNNAEANISIWSTGTGSRTLGGCRRVNPQVQQGGKPHLYGCDVDGNRKGDIMLSGGASWTTIPVGVSNGTASFSDTNQSVSSFPLWAQDPL